MTEARSAGASPAGLDLARLRAYLIAEHPDVLDGPLHADLIAGGRSNLTYYVRDACDREVVVRRPPLGHVLATAHDMAREYRLLDALTGSPVPVPRPILFCDDIDVIGAPFYVMERVTGTAYRYLDQLVPLGADRVAEVCRRMVATLVDLHEVDPGAVGLGDLGRPVGFLARQVERWRRQLEQSRSRELPGLTELHDTLAAKAPAADARSRASLVHGDYRLDNLLIDDSCTVVAVLDWEMATRGDPLTDLALLATYTAEATRSPHRPGMAAAAPGFPASEALIAGYAEASGHEVDRFGFYLGLAFYKTVGILEGIHYRYLAGKAVGITYADAGARVQWLIDAGLEAVNS